MQDQNIDHSEITDSDVRLGNAGSDLIQGSGNSITKIYVDLVGQTHRQWTNNQRRILERVQEDVETRLLFTLNDDAVLIPLHLREEGARVSRASLRLRSKLVTPQTQDEDLKQAILDVFCRPDIRGQLRILGAPGAGKTTTLLTLAKELLVEAFATPGTAIPVIFELSAWKTNSQLPTLRDWLIAQLQEMFNLQPQEGAQWLDDQLLLPLLDGLDELGMEEQQQCIAAINAFAETYPRVVVCCRVREYRESGAVLDSLPGQVYLEPLTDSQIEQYLHDLGLENLWQAIQSSSAMSAMLTPDAEGNPGILRVPLLLSMAALAYDEKPFANRAELYAAYIEQRLHYDTRKEERKWRRDQDQQWAYETLTCEPKSQQTLRTLGWLARQLQQTNRIELLIERIQPSWLETNHSCRLYCLVIGLIVGSILGVIVGSILGVIVGLTVRLIFGVISGLFFGLVVGQTHIRPVEVFKISMSHNVRRESSARVKKWLIGGLFFGIIWGAISSLNSDPSIGLIIRLISGITSGAVCGVIGGLILGLISELKQDLEVRSYPNQGIWESLKNAIWLTTIMFFFFLPFQFIAPPGTYTVDFYHGKDRWLILNYLCMTVRFLQPSFFGALLFGFLFGGGVSCVKHVCLRVVLWQSGIAPWNLARFLNYCVERRLLQRVGGRYRFLHRELLDHFAQ